MDALKSGFIGVITHELRTPFANLNFSLQLMERYGLDGWHQDQREQLYQLKEGIGRAKQMVDNLVTFATLLSKQGELEIEEIDLAQLVETSIQPLRPLAESKSLTFRTTIPAALPLVDGDRERLGDAVYHLAQNAVKFSDAGTVDVRCRVEPGTICFEVEDTGIGVPADRLPALWNSFTQMADPLRRGVEGLGLGLALVRLVVRAHGGKVYAESTEGVGSTFGFCIPTGCVPLGAEAQVVEIAADGDEVQVGGMQEETAVSEPEAEVAQAAPIDREPDVVIAPSTGDQATGVEATDSEREALPDPVKSTEETPASEPPEPEAPAEDDFDDLRKGLLG